MKYKVKLGNEEIEIVKNEDGTFSLPKNKKWLMGIGTATKPAVEEWILIRKPLEESTVAAQVLKTSTGGLNIDACRVGTEIITINGQGNDNLFHGKFSGKIEEPTHTGRFPANLILTCTCENPEYQEELVPMNGEGNDKLFHGKFNGGHNQEPKKCKTIKSHEPDCPCGVLDKQSGATGAMAPVKSGHSGKSKGIYNDYAQRGDDGATFYGDGLAGASRFFQQFTPDYDAPFIYQAKSSTKERNYGIKQGELQWECVEQNQVEKMAELSQQLKDILEDTMLKQKDKKWNIELFGDNTSEIFQKDFKSIIRMGTKQITTFQILNLLILLHTKESIRVATKIILENGLNLAEIAENIKKLKETITNEKTEYALTVSLALLSEWQKIKEKAQLKSNHPTVKSLKLMTYLIRLITPPEGVVLDCFMGSGSTGVAAKQAGFKFVGIEKEKEYFKLAKKRIKNI